jgi:AcrR family transcriptional regulator
MTSHPCDGRVDPRTTRSRERVLAATHELLRELGAGGLTVEAVSARSGVAKTTIYRHFEDRDDLMFSVFESLAEPSDVPVEHGVVGDVEAWLQAFVEALRTADFAQLVPVMIAVAERDDRGAELAEAFARRRRRCLGARLERAVHDGELREDADVDLLISQLVGPLFYRRYISRQATPADLVTRLVRSVLVPVLAAGAAPGGAGGGPPRSAR